MPKQQESCLDWTPHKAEIKEHYLVQDLSLKELLKYMEETHAFRATSEAQYETQLKKWDFRKNMTKKEWDYTLLRMRKRKFDGKESDVYFNGSKVPEKKVKKQMSRHFSLIQEQFFDTAPIPSTPEAITVATPQATVDLAASSPNLSQLSPPIAPRADSSPVDGDSATESRKRIPVGMPESNIGDNQPVFNSAIPSPTRNLDILHENQARLLSNSYLKSSQNEEMVQLREERIFDSSDKDTNILESRSNLANSYLELGLYKEAMQLLQQILEVRKRLLGDEHPNTLKVMSNLAKSFIKLGRYQEAMPLYTQTLELRKRVLGDEHPDTLWSMNNLAASYSHLGQYQEAMPLYIQTLKLQKRILGDEHPDTLWSMSGLATSYTNLGQYQEAMPLYTQTLEMQKRILGDEHPDTLWSMNGLAASYSHLGQYQEAMPLYIQTLELQKRILGDEHPNTLRSMNGLAGSYSHLGQHQEAMPLYTQTLELRKRVLGDEHPSTLRTMKRLASFCSALGQYQEAMQLGRQTVEAQQRILGPAHPDTLSSARMLARISANGQTRQKKDTRTKSPRRIS
ncbi:hypothetical protein MMC31_007389 [Peltigera leucophlebia]|nr:hypothetical protein [Peltigera leucophlebia]